MSVDYKKISHNLMDLECYRRYSVHTLLRDSGIYFGQPPVLEYLKKHGTCTQNEVAKAMNVSPASMAVSIKRMQKTGLVEKVSDKTDLRCNKVSLTEKGLRCASEISARFEEMDEKIFSGFSDDELKQFNSYIERINKNLSAGLPDKRCMFEMLKNEYKHKNEGDNE